MNRRKAEATARALFGAAAGAHTRRGRAFVTIGNPLGASLALFTFPAATFELALADAFRAFRAGNVDFAPYRYQGNPATTVVAIDELAPTKGTDR